MKQKKYTPSTEYIDHINIHSNSKMALGQQLSNFYRFKTKHPEHGEFESVEGFYYWLLTGKKHNNLRSLYGVRAREVGKKLDVKEDEFSEEFIKEIKTMILLKIHQNPIIKRNLSESTLPLTLYYFYEENDEVRIINLPKFQYIVDIITQYRDLIQEDN